MIPLRFMNTLFDSALLRSGGEIPEGHYEAQNMKQTVVPFRNAIMLSIATGFAESFAAAAARVGDKKIVIARAQGGPPSRAEAAPRRAERYGTENSEKGGRPATRRPPHAGAPPAAEADKPHKKKAHRTGAAQGDAG